MTESPSNAPSSETRGSLKQIRGDLMVLTKARLSVLVVMTACFGYLLATKGGVTFSWVTLLHTFLGTVLAASGAAVFNQLMEVESDARMRRTSDRPLPAKRLPKPAAFIIGWLLAGFGIVHLGVKVNASASVMAGATLFTYLFIYTPMKRISTANTLVGAVSGALPPLIGWAAGGRSLLDPGSFFLFGLLFFWQLPHFAAINWIYREEYIRGGFKMWSNDDESGSRTARIAVAYSVCLTILAVTFPFVSTGAEKWGAAGGGLCGVGMVLLSLRFLKTGDRSDARRLFFYTLLYLPAMMLVCYLAWKAVTVSGA